MAEEDIKRLPSSPLGNLLLYCDTLLHDFIHKEAEVYMDDMIINSKERMGHVPTLSKFFIRLRKYNMRLYPQKCPFRVTSRKLLGHVASLRGNEVQPLKIKAL